jgi:hypothetical protein
VIGNKLEIHRRETRGQLAAGREFDAGGRGREKGRVVKATWDDPTRITRRAGGGGGGGGVGWRGGGRCLTGERR